MSLKNQGYNVGWGILPQVMSETDWDLKPFRSF